MSVVDDSTTFGRARLSFADEAEIDEFVTVLGRFERGEISPDQWPVPLGPRHLWAAPGGRRADAARQDSPGRALTRPACGAGGCGRLVLARLRAHHDAAEHAVPLRQAARRRTGDAPARPGGADDS